MKIEPNNLYLGDCYELIKEIPDKSVDLILTDPPYSIKGLDSKAAKPTGIFKEKDSRYLKQLSSTSLGNGIDLKVLDEFVRVMKKINIYIWCNKEQIYDYLTYFVKNKKCNWEMIIWGKINPPPFLNGHYLKDKEYCLFFWEQGVKIHPSFETGKTIYISPTNVADKNLYNHPTIKDLGIIKNLILNSTGGGLYNS